MQIVRANSCRTNLQFVHASWKLALQLDWTTPISYNEFKDASQRTLLRRHRILTTSQAFRTIAGGF